MFIRTAALAAGALAGSMIVVTAPAASAMPLRAICDTPERWKARDAGKRVPAMPSVRRFADRGGMTPWLLGADVQMNCRPNVDMAAVRMDIDIVYKVEKRLRPDSWLQTGPSGRGEGEAVARAMTEGICLPNAPGKPRTYAIRLTVDAIAKPGTKIMPGRVRDLILPQKQIDCPKE